MTELTALQGYLNALKAQGFSGDIETNYGARVVAATDNSIYQVLPQAIVYPKTTNDISVLAQVLAAHPEWQVSLTARGGNTGTNGQSLNNGIIVDMARYLTEIVQFDLAKREVTVQPGVVLDQLNAFLAPHGLFFPPNVSTSSRATIGGMVATDASGKGSRRYGKTSDYIAQLEVVLADGTELTIRGNEPITNHPLYQNCYDLLAPHQAEIGRVFPKMNRGLTGYNLKQALVESAEPQINLAYLLAGSEGTLALTKSITVRAIPLPKYEALVAVFYADFLMALRHVPILLQGDPIAIEVLDDKILQLAQNDSIWQDLKGVLGDALAHTQQPILGTNFIQVAGDTPEQVASQCAQLLQLIQDSSAEYAVVATLQEQRKPAMNALWSLRARAVGLLGGLEGARRGIPFVEDAAVPPEHLPAFVADFRALLDSYGLSYGMFGHADVGCLHVRPMLDMRAANDQALIRPISDGVAQLTKHYGGLLWGEHGRGYRGEYSPLFFEPNLYPVLEQLKALFDPFNRLNPGKLAVPKTPTAQLPHAVNRIDAIPLRGEFDATLTPKLAADYHDAVRCNGNGQCFSWSSQEAMCPSYRATKNRAWSPKGRAALLREWARLVDKPTTEPALLSGLESELTESLNTCLSCKSCAYSCPVKVDVPELKSRFLETYYQKQRRPVRDYLFANFEPLANWGRRFPRLTNALMHNPLGQWSFKRFGVVELPSFSQVLRIQAPEKPTLTLVPDSFNASFDHGVLSAAIEVLGASGVEVELAPVFNNGKALHVKGFRKRFAKIATQHMQALQTLAQAGKTLVSVDVVTRLLYQHEYTASVPDLQAPPVQALEGWLAANTEALQVLKKRMQPSTKSALVLPHCMEQTASKVSLHHWQTIFQALELPLTVRSSGCCGMAGLFGHEAPNRELSKQIFAMHWQAPVQEAVQQQQVLLATGFSCRCQLREHEFEVLHPWEYLLGCLASASLSHRFVP